MRVYFVLHIRPLTLHWSDRCRLEAPVISPDLSRVRAPPPIFTITISNFNFQFLPPSSSQFATKLHPWERRWGDCWTRACKHIYNVEGVGVVCVCACVCVGGAHITIDYCHVECKCSSVCVQHEDLSFCFECLWPAALINTYAYAQTHMKKKQLVNPEWERSSFYGHLGAFNSKLCQWIINLFWGIELHSKL